jgi:mannose-1-phosphate guanylyltransferase / mannose-6-phosphate isomerase
MKDEGTSQINIYNHGEKAERPWGSWELLDKAPGFAVKRIVVEPGKRLSLQMHYHRAEHWIVVKGTALVTCDEKESLVYENGSIALPLGCIHRLENPGRIPLIIVEIQVGSYLGEDDIIRLDDDHGRITENPKKQNID